MPPPGVKLNKAKRDLRSIVDVAHVFFVSSFKGILRVSLTVFNDFSSVPNCFL